MSRAAVLLLLGSLAPPAPAAAGGGRAAELLAEGNARYEAGDYAAAAAAYRGILEYGVRNEIVHYNLGNALFKGGNLGEAILHYERALRYDPRDREAAENLAYAVTLTADRVEAAAPSTPWRVVTWLRTRTTPGEDAALLLVALYLLGGAAAAAILVPSRRARRALGYLGAVLLAVALASGTSLLLKEVSRREARAVILAEKVDVRSGPASDHTALFTVHEGLRVRLRGRREGWAQILLSNGLNGWVPAGSLEAVP